MTNPVQATSIEEAIKLAQTHHQARRLGKAEAIYRQILAINPNHYQALHLLGILGSQIGQFEQAAALIRLAIQQNPTDHAAHNNLGEVLVKSKRLDEAIACFRRAVALKPDYFHAHYNLGVALVEQGYDTEGMESIEKGLAHNLNSASQVKINMAGIHQRRGNHGVGLGMLVKETGFIRFTQEPKVKLLFPSVPESDPVPSATT